jgi:cysteine desulfurase/selenocysteine lyase
MPRRPGRRLDEPMDITSIRSRFPSLSERIYLNSASEGPMPETAIAEAERIARLKGKPWEIGNDLYYRLPAEVRERLETLLHAPTGSVALVPGTSAGIGIAARGLPLSPGDEVLLLDGQFPSNVNPWRAVTLRGATVRLAPRPFGTDPAEARLRAVSASTRVISIDWVNFIDGAVADLSRIAPFCRERGIRLVVDGAQGAGALPIDVGALGIDAFAGPSHKWLLGPAGCGFVFVAPELLDRVQPWNAGWMNLSARGGFRNLQHVPSDPTNDATRFETGTPAYGLLSPWNLSLSFLEEIGPDRAAARVVSLAARAASGIAGLSPAAGGSAGLSLLIPVPPAQRSGIVSFRAEEDRTLSVYRSLGAAGITAALREGAIRVSAHVFNTEDEIDFMIDTCRKALG